MTKKKQTRKRGRSLAGTILTLIILIAAAYFGVNESGDNDTDTGGDNGTVDTTLPSNLEILEYSQGFGASRDFWQVYFTAPEASDDRTTCNGGVDEAARDAIDGVQNTLDIAAFEWGNACLTEAVIRAKDRGVTVRMVVDNVHTIDEHDEAVDFEEPSPFGDIIAADIPYRDDARSGLMHNKFMILDGAAIITGSMNFTINGSYRNNNNMLIMRSRRAAEIYQAEFNEMYESGQFGSKRSAVNGAAFNQDGVPIEILFSPEDDPISAMLREINAATTSIRFMTFSFTRDDVGMAVVERAGAGVDVAGVFETTGSETAFSEMTRMFCASVPVFQDGNPGILHHKVFIIDGETVLTGSFNISDNATDSNDENLVIIKDADIAALYLAEWERVRSIARDPDPADLTCS